MARRPPHCGGRASLPLIRRREGGGRASPTRKDAAHGQDVRGERLLAQLPHHPWALGRTETGVVRAGTVIKLWWRVFAVRTHSPPCECPRPKGRRDMGS